MPTRGYAACRDSSRTLAWALVVLTATSALVHATEQDVQASVGVALEPAPPPGYFRVIIQVSGPEVKATPGLVQLLAETLASGTGLQPSNVAPGMTLNNSRCFDSPPPVTNAGRRLAAAFPDLLQPGHEKAYFAPKGTETSSGRHSSRKLQQGCLTTILVELDIDATSRQALDYQNQTQDYIISGQYQSQVAQTATYVEDIELAELQNSQSAPMDFDTAGEWEEATGTWPGSAPDGPAQAPATLLSQPVEFQLVLVGPDAVITYQMLITSLYQTVLGMLATSQDFVNSSNTAVSAVKALDSRAPADISQGGGSKRLLLQSAASANSSQWMEQQVQDSKLQITPPLPLVSINASQAPSTADAPAPALDTSQPTIRVTFTASNLTSVGLRAVYTRLVYAVRYNQLLQALQAQGLKIYALELTAFEPTPDSVEAVQASATASPSTPPTPTTPSQPPAYIPVDPRKPPLPPQKGLHGGLLAAVIIIPIIAVGVGAVGAGLLMWCRMRLRRRSAMREQLPSSIPEGEGESRSLETLFSGLKTKASSPTAADLFAVPWNDWEITNPSDIAICTRKDGSEWLLGAGASGRVYKATIGGVQTVAVKVFTDQASTEAASASKSEEFQREIAILKACRDKNIVTFIGASLQVGRTILVTEFLENGDLYNAIANSVEGQYGWYRRRLSNGKPAPGVGLAKRIALDVAKGLVFLHTRKVAHRDLKSANILIARDFTAKIADVGMARILHKEYLSSLREVGTFAWAAPEVLLGQQCRESVDIYSYGVILWELSSLDHPASRQLRPLRVPHECPVEIEQLMHRCLDVDPNARPSALEIVQFLSPLKIAFREELEPEPSAGSGAEVQLAQCNNDSFPRPPV